MGEKYESQWKSRHHYQTGSRHPTCNRQTFCELQQPDILLAKEPGATVVWVV